MRRVAAGARAEGAALEDASGPVRGPAPKDHASTRPRGPLQVALLLKPYDERVVVRALGEDRRKLSRWLEDQMLPLVVPFLPEYMDMIFGGSGAVCGFPGGRRVRFSR